MILLLTDDRSGHSYRAETDQAGRADFVELFAGTYRLHTAVPSNRYEDMPVTLQGGESLSIEYRPRDPLSLPGTEEPDTQHRSYLPFVSLSH